MIKYMKVAICTIESENFGNKLQNYALQKIFEDFGYEVRTFRRNRYSLRKRIKDGLRVFVKKDRFTNFFLFSRNIKWDYDYLKEEHVPKSINRYDCFVIGSDQIWNPTFSFSSEIDYLPFVDSDKIVSFSASFGIDFIPEQYRGMVKEGVNHIKNISVREEAGARIVKELTQKDATVLIDPTMMIDVSTWMKIAKPLKKVDCNKPYILVYFLGGVSERVERDLYRFSKENNMQVYNILDDTQPNVFASGPSEFLYLISHARLVMTDSFHACVFSFLFQKPFLIYAREGKEKRMMSRMDTFLSRFHLERKYIDSGLENELFEADYGEGYKQLEVERKKVLHFLKESMGVENLGN